MGQELDCTVHLGKRRLAGRALLESDHVLFRGTERLKVPLKSLTAVKAADGILTLEFDGGPAAFELGAAAEKWAHKILHPPSRLDKLGVKSGVSVLVAGTFEPDFAAEWLAAGAKETTRDADLVFLAAAKSADLAKIPRLATRMKPAGGLWVVYPKGVTAIREIDVLNAGRAAGLKDTKVASFSATHTALRFVLPVSAR